MESTFVRGVRAAAGALLMLTITACAANTETSPNPGNTLSAPSQASSTEAASDDVSLAAAQGDIPWPRALTLPKPAGMSFDGIETEYACDGALLSTLVSSPDATTQTTQAYLEEVQTLFGITPDVRAGHGAGSLFDRSGALKDDSHLQNAPSAADATQIIGWERLDTGGYRFHLQETSTPGNLIGVNDTPPTAWAAFPRPDAGFESCIARESSGYREGTGFTPPSTTWVLTASSDVQPQLQDWMRELAADGWTTTAAESGPKPGAPQVILTSEDFTAQYVLNASSLVLFVGDRKLDKFLGLS